MLFVWSQVVGDRYLSLAWAILSYYSVGSQALRLMLPHISCVMFGQPLLPRCNCFQGGGSMRLGSAGSYISDVVLLISISSESDALIVVER